MSEQSLRALSDREKARIKLPVFYGSFDNYKHGLLETLMNSRDELINNFEKGEIIVTVEEDLKTVEVFDSGRGIPLMGETNGVKNYVLLFETLFAGGNYDNLEEGKTTTGTNGCGASTLSFTSEFYEVESYKGNKVYGVKYKDGGIFQEYYEGETSIPHGTLVRFKLDDTIYTRTKYDIDDIRTTLNRLSSTTNKVVYKLNYLEETQEFYYETNLEYVADNMKNTLGALFDFPEKTCISQIVKEGKELEESDRIKAIISLSTEPLQETYLNGTYLPEQGTIFDGVVEGLKKVFNKEVNKKVKLTTTDIAMSFNIYAYIDSTNPVFSGQTKFSASNVLYKKLMANYIVENMEIIKNEQPKEFEAIIKHLTAINQFNTKNEENRKKVRKELEEKATTATSRPKKLVPCRSKDPNVVELILIEGDSALNSIKLGRDATTMMVYPLKGKPMNPLKKSIDAIMQNQEIRDIFKILGCGVTYKGKNVKGFPLFDISNLTVNKIIVATDQDEDGFHIQALLIGIFYILAPQLLVEEKVEFLRTPLYIIKYKNEEIFAYSEKERTEIVSQLTGAYKETRFKGLGGLSTQTMSRALKHETRESIVVTMEEAEKCAKKIELFLSDDVESRKKYIEEFGSAFVTESLLV